MHFNWVLKIFLKTKMLCFKLLFSYSTVYLHSHLASGAIGVISGNVHQNGSKNKAIGQSTCQLNNKSSKRKQVAGTSEIVTGTNENESLQHLHSKRPKTARKCLATAKNKLIAGQAKLTHFFRL